MSNEINITVSHKTIAEWKQMVDDNDHSAVVWLKARFFREKLEDAQRDYEACAFLEIAKQAKAIFDEHEETGNISEENYAKRHRLNSVLALMIRAVAPEQADEINNI